LIVERLFLLLKKALCVFRHNGLFSFFLEVIIMMENEQNTLPAEELEETTEATEEINN